MKKDKNHVFTFTNQHFSTFSHGFGGQRERGKGKKGIMERERKKGLDREREIGKGKEVRGKRERDRRHGEGGRKQGRG